MPAGHPLLYTVGHSTRALDEFVALLRSFDVERIVDVRTVPRSRHNPQFDHDTLAATLRDRRLDYHHMPSLGGLRRPRSDSPNLGWRNPTFRGFADYMQTEAFDEALRQLIVLCAEMRTAVMCAEAVPWRCHRSLIADALVARGYSVEHIMTPGVSRKHVLNPLAVVDGDRVSYPAEQQMMTEAGGETAQTGAQQEEPGAY
jgi:uncharacterized protein (DUF488 family)